MSYCHFLLAAEFFYSTSPILSNFHLRWYILIQFFLDDFVSKLLVGFIILSY